MSHAAAPASEVSAFGRRLLGRLPNGLPVTGSRYFLLLACLFSTAVLGGVAAAAYPLPAVLLALALVVAVAVVVRPVLAPCLLLVATPLVVGIDRGKLLPVLRPHETLVILLALVLLARAVAAQLSRGTLSLPRFTRVDGSIALLVLTGSVMPLLWLLARGHPLSSEDVFYSIRLGHYVAVYAIFRSSVTREEHVRICLLLSVTVGCVVALLGILEVMGMFGVADFLRSHYALEASTDTVTRAAATTGSPFAYSDILLFNLAIALAWLTTLRSKRRFFLAATALLVLGTVASGQFSALIGFLVITAAVAGLRRRILVPLGLFLTVAASSVALKPVLVHRAAQIDPAARLPNSWIARFENLQTYFWPELFSRFNYVLGVRPSVQVPSRFDPQSLVFIESGHTWLLWIGGIPFLVGFCVFAAAALKATHRIATGPSGPRKVAGIASFAALLVMVVLMTFDPHLTYRGSGDLNFSLLALATAGPLVLRDRPSTSTPPRDAVPARTPRSRSPDLPLTGA